ncbi:hypothetical protein EVAR_82428_1 [Eumeta japonica]|uniref:Uncharacterized protein n=1 Tax=Eumeta variegata TaxID=151549 RepID=A0A4C1YIV3_EUMVA|nr:hypothetical protein EVAR_82428_1 [Eumeta japonica]
MRGSDYSFTIACARASIASRAAIDLCDNRVASHRNKISRRARVIGVTLTAIALFSAGTRPERRTSWRAKTLWGQVALSFPPRRRRALERTPAVRAAKADPVTHNPRRRRPRRQGRLLAVSSAIDRRYFWLGGKEIK